MQLLTNVAPASTSYDESVHKWLQVTPDGLPLMPVYFSPQQKLQPLHTAHCSVVRLAKTAITKLPITHPNLKVWLSFIGWGCGHGHGYGFAAKNAT